MIISANSGCQSPFFMPVIIWILSLLLSIVSACSFHANASPEGAPDAATSSSDATGVAGDAAGDAAPFPRTLHQTNDDAIAPGASAACQSGSHTAAETWYRAFQLSDYAISSSFHVTEVDIGVQSAQASSAITVEVDLYTGSIGGSTIDLSRATYLASAQVTPPSTGMLAVPIAAAIPAGGAIVVRVAAPDMAGSSSFIIGSTTAGEAHPGYFAAPTCGISAPQTTVAVGASGQIVIDVKGEVP